MKTQTEHTPLPWSDSGSGDIVDQNGAMFVQANDVTDAAHIVRCVNAHDALVGALKVAKSALIAKETFRSMGISGSTDAGIIDTIKAALKLADGGITND